MGASQPCRICVSETSIRGSIERELLKGKTYRVVAKQFSEHFKVDLHNLEQSIGNHYRNHLGKNNQTEESLSQEELNFLERVGKGEVSLEEATRVVAKKAFEKILKNPNSIKVENWLQSELLKIKRQEVENQNSWRMELIDRMWLGQLPPQACPKCGHNWYKDHPLGKAEANHLLEHRVDDNQPFLEGEVVHE